MDVMLEHKRAPGDILMMTCAIRDLHRAQQGKHRTDVATSAMAIWQHNPHVTHMPPSKAKYCKLSYGSSVKQANQRRAHFTSAFNQHLSEFMGFKIPLTELRGQLYLSDAEKDPENRLIKKPYWVIAPGGKSDFTAKLWDRLYWQDLVNRLKEDTVVAQIGAKSSSTWMQKTKGHLLNYSPALKGVRNLVGKTNFRQMLSTIYHAEGVICLTSFPMHVAAALNKPCVVIGGGREGWWWEAYTRATWEANCTRPVPDDFVEHRYLHTIGKLECCNGWGCWKSGVGDKANSNCKHVVKGPSQPQPKCLTQITPEMVAQAVADYKAGKPVPVEKIPSNLEMPLSSEPLPKKKPPARKIVDTRPKMRARVKYTHRTPNAVKVKEETARAHRVLRPPQRTRVSPQPKKRQILQPAREARRVHMKVRVPAQNKPATAPAPAPVTRPRVQTDTTASGPVKHVQRILTADTSLKPPITVCVLIYGDFLDIISRCLTSVAQKLPQGFANLRLGMNDVSPRVRKWVEANVHGARIYDEKENIFKYPLMRKMFNDPPIDTEWVMWLDDDSHITAKNFAEKLTAFVQNNPCDYVGKHYFYPLAPGQIQWIKAAPWYGGKGPATYQSPRTKHMVPKVDFATGGFWLIRTEVIRALDWPDKRISHNFGDVSLGEAIRQNDYRFGKFNHGVAISDCKRRGASQRHPGR